MYNLELERIVSEIKKADAKTVIIQLPDGLKPKAKEIQEFLKKNTDAEIMFWGGSCFGACDTPNLQDIKADFLIQFGHSEWKKPTL